MIKLIQNYDHRSFLSVSDYTRHFQLENLARKLSASADGWYYLLLIPGLLLFRAEHFLQYAYTALLGFSIERLVYYSLKNTLRRRRPYDAIHGFRAYILAADRFSLPSGHSSAAFFFVTFLVISFGPVFLLLYPWAVLVALSRVMLGVHFLSDVIIGALIGCGIASLLT